MGSGFQPSSRSALLWSNADICTLIRVPAIAICALVVAVHNLGKLFGSGRAGRVLPGWTPTTGRATRWATG